MKWKWIVAAVAVAGVAVAARRSNQKTVQQGQTWAAATDPIHPSGDS